MSTPTLILALSAILAPAALAQSAGAPVTFDSLLTEMADRAALAHLPNYTCKQFSSYDPASTSPDNQATWFANGDQGHYLRTEQVGQRKEYVMADMAGPGAVVRLWSPDPKGTLRIYLDGAKAPTIEAPMKDLMEGKVSLAGIKIPEPIAATRSMGWNCYLPIPYAKSCKITSDATPFYYHVNYRTYPANTQVESFSQDLVKRHGDSLALTRDALLGKADGPILPGEPALIAPGADQSLEFSAAGSPGQAVDGLAVSLKADDLEQALRSTVIIASFDGEQTVWAPIGDFFGSGVGLNTYADRYKSVSPEGVLTARFVMPFAKAAKITFKNLGDKPVSLGSFARLAPWRFDADSMHFHAAWRTEYPIHTKKGEGTKDWNYVEIQGKGVYVGDSLAVMNPVPQWWGEGDEKIYVDGEKFPSHFGTGTEDYYGYGWCCPVIFSMPFNGQPRCDGRGKNNYGHTTVSRVRALDAIPFSSSYKFDIEVWHWAETDVAYAATTYFYALPGAKTNRTPDEAGAKAPVPQPPPLPPPFAIPGALEAEKLAVAAKSQGMDVEPQDMEGFGARKWSGETHLWCKGRAVGDFVELKIPAPAGERKVTLYASKSWDYATVQFSLNGAKCGDPVDLFSGKQGSALPTGPVELGAATSKDGFIILRAEITGHHEKSLPPQTFFGLDAVILH